MCNTISPQAKKTTLIVLIDDMTAAALDRSSQGYSQFLQCRDQLIKTIDEYVEADVRRDMLAETIAQNINEYFDKTFNSSVQ